MKYILVVLVLCAILFQTLASMAQSRQQLKNDSVFALIKQYVNARQTIELYKLTGEKLRNEVPSPAFSKFTEQQLFPLGDIRLSALISFQDNKLSTYKVEFGAVSLQLLLTLDNQNKLETFLFQPYKIPAPVKTIVATSNKMLTLTDKKVDTAAKLYILKGNTAGLSIGIYRAGRVSSYNYGETKRGDGILPSPDNIFELGSITKTFTATLLAWYVNSGKLNLTDPITRFLPDSVSTNQELQHITLLMLSNHTSGLQRLPEDFSRYEKDPKNPYKDYTRRNLFTYLKTCKLVTAPGDKYAYSNLAVGLLGVILEQVSGKTYEQMVDEIICRPLGMKSTVQHVTPLLAKHLVTVYNADGEETPVWDFGALAALGSYKSSVNDMLIYVRANMHPGVDPLSRAFILAHQVTFTKDVRIGLAWHIIKVNNVDYYFHNGGTAGSSSFMAYNSTKNLAIIVLSNSGENVDAVGVELLKKLQ